MKNQTTRREFLATASAGTALAFTASSYGRIRGANERISLGLIGCGGRGYGAFMPNIRKHEEEQPAEFTAVSDPWRPRRERAVERCREWYGRPARSFVSYRQIMERDDVDAVMIASCDHHHAVQLEAAAAVGKDAYVEKPLAMDMESLIRCCDAAKAAGIVVQNGTQVRSFPTSTGCRDLFRTGEFGKVSRIEQCRNSTRPYWYNWMQRAEPIREEDVDWEEFLMDRPMRPFDGKLLTGWYGYREFSDGPLSNLGVHFIDLYNYILGTTLPVSCVAHGGTFTWRDEYEFTCPDHCQALWTYPEDLMVSYSTNFGNGSGNVLKIYGEQGVLDLTRWTAPTYSSAGAIKSSELPGEDQPVPPVDTPDHYLDWLQCLRTREECNAPIDAGYHHCVPALMAIRAFDSGRRQIYDAEAREIRDG